MLLALVGMVVCGQTPSADALDIEALLDTEIETSIGRIKQRTSDVAGALTVLRGEELRQRGYTTLAQALREVPGLYAATDLTTVNLGVRGITAGAGAAGNTVKVLIDGNAVSFLPTNGNFFGEELISLDAVERIEVLRSPASALFGANAFLGVINIVTRSGEALRTGARLTGSVGLVRDRLQVGGTATVSAAVDQVELLLSFQQFRVDRSGLALPPSSPALSREGATPAAERSESDVANPQSLFGRVTLANVAGGRLSLIVAHQRLDASSQFLGFAPLRRESHTTLTSQSVRVLDERKLAERVELRSALSVSRSTFEPTTRIDLGNDGEIAQAHGGAVGFGASLEAAVRLTDALNLTLGVDFSRDVHDVLGYSTLRTQPLTRSDGSVLLPAGSLLAADPNQLKLLWNVGGWAQAVFQITPLIGLTAGVRVDGHNIYGPQVSPRVGLVLAQRGTPWSAKLLFGSAFKAPSAVELFGRPLTTFDLIGNPALKPQYARSIELLSSYRVPLTWAFQVSLFATAVDQLVTYEQTTRYFEAENGPRRWYFGGEAEFEWTPVRPLLLKASLGLVRPYGTQDPLSALMPVFPSVQGRVSADVELPWLRGLHLCADVTVIGPRLATSSNAIERFAGYSLPATAVVSANASLLDQRWLGERKSSVRLRVDNLLDSRYADPGYGGVDLPALGRTVLLSFTQEL